jgi:steroid delta-isomerase-like uncharacterized protein
MLDLIKKHLADFSASKWTDYKAPLAADVTYEEMATRQRVRGADEYLKAVQRWKGAFPDLRATITSGVVSGDKVVVEVEWEGTHTGPFAGPFGEIAATNKRGRVPAVMVFTVKNGKIVESHHYFDLLTVLIQIGVAPMAMTQPAPKTPGAPAPRHH